MRGSTAVRALAAAILGITVVGASSAGGTPVPAATAGADTSLFVPGFVSAGASTPIVRTVTPTLTPPLRDLVPIPPEPSGGPIEVSPFQEPGPAPGPRDRPDPVVQRAAGTRVMPAPIMTFEGLNNDDNPGTTLVLPPDVEGDVGPNHYFEWVNIAFRIFDRAGAPLTAPMAGNTLFASLPSGKCKTTNSGDPLVLYDQFADRWVVSQFTGSAAPQFQCTAVSKTPDPTGAYYLYPFQIPVNTFNDYGKIGLWPDAYHFSFAGFPGGGGFTPAVMAVERAKMLAGLPAQLVYFESSTSPALAASAQQRLLPADLDGSTLPPVGEPTPYVMHDDVQDQLEVYEFHVDWTTPALSAITKVADLPVAPFDTVFTCNTGMQTRQCIPQPATANRIDVLATRLMYRLAYRNFGTHQALVVNQSVDADVDHAGVRWYELRDPHGTPTVHQQATYAPGTPGELGDHRWMGSAAMDNDGNLAIGYSISNHATIFPSIRYAGRLATDPPNELTQGEATMFAGAGSQIAANFVLPTSTARWGDYTHMSIDPVDDCTSGTSTSTTRATRSSRPRAFGAPGSARSSSRPAPRW
ncbi:MAG: hypothetical protein ABR521_04545 [Gaiellaceae bacterium]